MAWIRGLAFFRRRRRAWTEAPSCTLPEASTCLVQPALDMDSLCFLETDSEDLTQRHEEEHVVPSFAPSFLFLRLVRGQ